MFPSFTSLSQRERKRQELLREAERELAIERHLNNRYAETMWAADNEASQIVFQKPTASTDTQTETSIPQGSTASVGTTTASSTGTATPGVFSAPSELTGDISIPNTVSSTAASDMVNLDTDHIMYRPDASMEEAVSTREDSQAKSYQAVVDLFEREPDIATWDLHPMFDPMLVKDGNAKSMRDLYFLGPGANLYHRSSRRAVRSDKQDDLVEQIDWNATIEYILNKILLVDGITRAREEREKLDMKRKAFDGLKTNVATGERLGESRLALNNIVSQAIDEHLSKDSRTDDINAEAKRAFVAIVDKNWAVVKANLLHEFNGKQGFYALGRSKDLQGLPEPLAQYYINPIDYKLRQLSNHRKSNTKERELSWPNTLQFLFQTAKNRNIVLDTSGTAINIITANKRPLEDSTVSNIIIEEKKPNRNELSRDFETNVDMTEAAGDYKKLIQKIYKANTWLEQEYLPPAVSKLSSNEVYHPKKYYIDVHAGIRKIKNKRPNLEVDSLASPGALARMNLSWPLTFQGVVDYLIQVVEFYGDHPDLLREHQFEEKLRRVRDSLRELKIIIPDNSRPINMADLEMTNDVSGRGLKGAGYIHKNLRDKEGNPIKYHSNRGYNLAQLEGTGTMSALAYKRIGTKFVHLPKLNENLLKVCYPNRSTVGPQRKISDDLARLIKTLVFDGNIDQQLYDSMSMDDKRVFHELLRITHTQHALRDPLRDPRDVLKQEYTKLKGEIMLGNDNPALIRELKQVLVDMYSAKLISDDEFKQVLVAIV